MSSASTINGNEKVVRILHRDWVVDNELQINAFALRQNETYISVNRPSIESYVSDVSDFVKNLKWLFDECSVDYDNVVITYVGKEKRDTTATPIIISDSPKRQYYSILQKSLVLRK